MARCNKPDPLDVIVLEHDMMLVTPDGKHKPLKAGVHCLINNPLERGPASQWFITLEEVRNAAYRLMDGETDERINPQED